MQVLQLFELYNSKFHEIKTNLCLKLNNSSWIQIIFKIWAMIFQHFEIFHEMSIA